MCLSNDYHRLKTCLLAGDKKMSKKSLPENLLSLEICPYKQTIL